ncbi:MAG: hypothetical protein FJW39_15645 [Acidobacteria bacterium]|nr:hypothetical protein [Acidobacteriota bacterium]
MRTLIFVTALLAGTLSASPNCGDVVTGNVKLTANLICNESHGLIVGANGTKIDLNGFSIQCIGSGVDGSCQRLLVAPPNNVAPAAVHIGIISGSKSNVQIKGPGTITGFGLGVRMSGGSNNKITGLTVTGPPQPDATMNQRLLNPGILVASVSCVVPGDFLVHVTGNDVSNQSIGIFLDNAECVRVFDNHVHDNNSRFGDAHGIDLLNSRNNFIHKNMLDRNGAGRIGGVSDSGIQLLNGALAGNTSNNIVQQNIVSDNCGDGINATIGANNNTIVNNTARFNGQAAFGGQCLVPPAGTFFDLVERMGGPGNVWNPNNKCRTSGPTIPVGVCGPAE